MPRAKTKPGTKRLSEVAKLVVAPSRIVSTGWPAVRDLCNKKLGIEFDGWQDGAGRLILAKREGGGLACQVGGVGMSLPRQVGKTYLIAALVFALCILRPKLLVIWSAHHSTTHEETFLSMQAFAERVKIKPYIAQIFKGSGDEEIRFRNGSRILFGARERGFGRGIPGVDLIVSDEAQIMTDKAVDAQLATMNTSDFGLAIYVGTPPRPDDPSEAFTRMRDEAWEGTLEDAVWIEVGAPQGSDPTDRRTWAYNPSYPHRTPAESILRLQRKLAPDSFMREGLGVWDETTGIDLPAVIDPSRWSALAVPAAPADGAVAYGVKFSPSGEFVALAAAVKPDAGPVHVEGVAIRSVVEGTRWLVDWLATRTAPVAVDGKSGAGALIAALRRSGVPERRVHRITTDQAITAAADLVNAATAGALTHPEDPAIAPDDVVRRAIGVHGGWGFEGRDGQDVSLFEAVGLAHWMASGMRTNRRSGRRVAVPG